MGLDISVYKVKKAIKPDEIEDFYVLSDFPELEVFEDFVFEKINNYYDLGSSLKDMGYNINELEWRATYYRRKSIFYVFVDLKHDLYEAYKYLSDVWNKCYFERRKDLFESEYYKKYLEFLPLLKKYGHRPSYKFLASGNGAIYCLNSARHFCERKIKFELKDPKTFDRVDRCIAYDEVGYQRKGANTQFYEDDMWDSPCVITTEVLQSHWEKYFSHKTPDSKGGFGAGVEFTMEDDEMKSRFKENIINNFIEGETFVIYH